MEFKKGDRVIFAGKTGTVTEVTKSARYPYRVALDAGREGLYAEAELREAGAEPSKEGTLMNKWDVEVTFCVAAPDRNKAWEVARRICDQQLADVANVKAVSRLPMPDAKEWIAVNEKLGGIWY